MDISPLRGYYAAHTPTLMGERGGSAVLVPLVLQNGEYCLLYEIRSAGLADKCQVQLAYAIGVAQPVSVLVDTFGTGTVGDEKLEEAVKKVFDLRPTAIIRDLDLRKPIYRQLAAYGHMGREDLGVSWEKTDRVEALKAALGK